MSLISIEGLTRRYPKTNTSVFEGLECTIEPHDFCFIVGRSGVGKTTLVKFLIRQLQPPKKMIFHAQEDIARFTRDEVQTYRRRIGVIYQDFKLIEWKTVAENVAYPLEIVGVEKTLVDQKVDYVLWLVWLQSKKETNITFLSWGEKQRVAIARALINSPEFIIADEPTGNLDHEAALKVADTLIELNKAGHTIIFITHNLQLIEYVREKQAIKVMELTPTKLQTQ